MPGDEDRNLNDPTENQDAGLEAEADATDPDSEGSEDGDDAEGAAEGDGSDAEEGQAEVDGEQRRPTRGEARFQTLSRRAQEANERASRVEAEARDLRERLARLEQPRQQQPQGKSPEELALMTPDELINYRLGEATKGFEQKLGAIQWATYESGDKAAWQARVARDPVAARLSEKVEQRLTQLRAQGQNVDRERLYTYLVGEEVLAKGATAKAKQGAAGQQRIQRQQTRAGSQQRSDTQSNRGRMSEQEAREKRLENLTF
jgi:hypothetical protein